MDAAAELELSSFLEVERGQARELQASPRWTRAVLVGGALLIGACFTTLALTKGTFGAAHIETLADRPLVMLDGLATAEESPVLTPELVDALRKVPLTPEVAAELEAVAESAITGSKLGVTKENATEKQTTTSEEGPVLTEEVPSGPEATAEAPATLASPSAAVEESPKLTEDAPSGPEATAEAPATLASPSAAVEEPSPNVTSLDGGVVEQPRAGSAQKEPTAKPHLLAKLKNLLKARQRPGGFPSTGGRWGGAASFAPPKTTLVSEPRTKDEQVPPGLVKFAEDARSGVKKFVKHVRVAVKARTLLGYARNKYSEHTAKAFAALAKLSYCGPLPGLFASAALTCMPLRLLGAESVCEAAHFSVVPGTVRMLRDADRGWQDSLFGYVAKVAPDGNRSSVKPGIVLVFRGSIDNYANSERDKQTALEGKPGSCKGCAVHEGYHKSFQQLWPQVKQYLQELTCEPLPLFWGVKKAECTLYVTGHGSGAAMAAMAAWELAQRGYAIGTSYLFEPPKVGNEAWANAMFSKFNGAPGAFGPIFLLTHGKDSAPRWPFEPAYSPWGFEAHYKRGAKKLSEICLAGWPGCGSHQYSHGELTHEDMCPNPLAPDGDFCTFHAFTPQCWGGMGFQIAATMPEDPPYFRQPSSNGAATWHPAEVDGKQARAMFFNRNPQDYFSLAQLRCVAALTKLSYCGDTIGLRSAVQSSVVGGLGLGQQCGWGVVPHAVETWKSKAGISEIGNDIPFFGFVALVRRNTAKAAEAPTFMPSESCVVAFRGTVDAQDKAMNKQTKAVALNDTACPGCSIHDGIHGVWYAKGGIGDQVVAALKRAGCVAHPRDTQVNKVWTIGHSMGGAHATFAMYYLQKLGFDVQLSWSIAGYRPGNQAFMDYLDDKIFIQRRPVSYWQIAHAKDGVARWPESHFSGGNYGRPQFTAYFSGENPDKYTLCTTKREQAEESKCGFLQVPRSKFAAFRYPYEDHCHLPFAPDGQVCMFSPVSQCFVGGSIAPL